MEEYKSQYKNPDKFILQLKRMLKESRDLYDRHMRMRKEELSRAEGEMVIHSWQDPSTDFIDINRITLDKFKIGDTVMQLGEVTKVTTSQTSSVENSRIEFKVGQVMRRAKR